MVTDPAIDAQAISLNVVDSKKILVFTHVLQEKSVIFITTTLISLILSAD